MESDLINNKLRFHFHHRVKIPESKKFQNRILSSMAFKIASKGLYFFYLFEDEIRAKTIGRRKCACIIAKSAEKVRGRK